MRVCRVQRAQAIQILWNWVFTFVGLEISDTPIGITWPLGAASLILIDSTFTNVNVGISEGAPGNGFFLLERVATSNVSKMLNTSEAAAPFYHSWRQGPALEVSHAIPGNQSELPASSRACYPLSSSVSSASLSRPLNSSIALVEQVRTLR